LNGNKATDAIGGYTLGADPIVSAVAALSAEVSQIPKNAQKILDKLLQTAYIISNIYYYLYK
jgi:hypothetical protein